MIDLSVLEALILLGIVLFFSFPLIAEIGLSIQRWWRSK